MRCPITQRAVFKHGGKNSFVCVSWSRRCQLFTLLTGQISSLKKLSQNWIGLVGTSHLIEPTILSILAFTDFQIPANWQLLIKVWTYVISIYCTRQHGALKKTEGEELLLMIKRRKLKPLENAAKYKLWCYHISILGTQQQYSHFTGCGIGEIV